MQIIPTISDSPFFRQITELDGTEYLFEFRYNTNCERWFMSIYRSDETPLAVGLVLRAGIEYSSYIAQEDRPEGLLYFVSTSAPDAECGIDDLGASFNLIYTTAEEINA